MAKYINDSGDAYDEEELIQFANEQDTTFDEIVSRNELKKEGEEADIVTDEEDPKKPGKKKAAAKKGAPVAAKSTASKLEKVSSVSSIKPTIDFAKTPFRPIISDRLPDVTKEISRLGSEERGRGIAQEVIKTEKEKYTGIANDVLAQAEKIKQEQNNKKLPIYEQKLGDNVWVTQEELDSPEFGNLINGITSPDSGTTIPMVAAPNETPKPDYMKIPDGDLITKSLSSMQNNWIKNNGLKFKDIDLKNGINPINKSVENGKLFLTTDEKALQEKNDLLLIAKKNNNIPEVKRLEKEINTAREDLNIGGKLYDEVTGKLLTVSEINTKKKEISTKAKNLADKNTGSTLETAQAKTYYELLALANTAFKKQNNIYNAESNIEKLGTFVKSIGGPYLGSETGFDADVKNLEEVVKTGKLPKNINQLPGNHPLAIAFNKKLEQYLVLTKAMELNYDPIATKRNSKLMDYASETSKAITNVPLYSAGQDISNINRKEAANAFNDVMGSIGFKPNDQVQLDNKLTETWGESGVKAAAHITPLLGSLFITRKLTGPQVETVGALSKELILKTFGNTKGVATAADIFVGGMKERTLMAMSDEILDVTTGAEAIDPTFATALGAGNVAMEKAIKFCTTKNIPLLTPVLNALAKSKASNITKTFGQYGVSTIGGSGVMLVAEGATMVKDNLRETGQVDLAKVWDTLSTKQHIASTLTTMGLLGVYSPKNFTDALVADAMRLPMFDNTSKNAGKLLEIDYKIGKDNESINARENEIDVAEQKALENLSIKNKDTNDFESMAKEEVAIKKAANVLRGDLEIANWKANYKGGVEQADSNALFTAINKVKYGEKLTGAEYNALSDAPMSLLKNQYNLDSKSPLYNNLKYYQATAQKYGELLDSNGIFGNTPERKELLSNLTSNEELRREIQTLELEVKENPELEPFNRPKINERAAKAEKNNARTTELLEITKVKASRDFELDVEAADASAKALGKEKSELLTDEEFKKVHLEIKGIEAPKDANAFVSGNKRYINKDRVEATNASGTGSHEITHDFFEGWMKDENGDITPEGIKFIDDWKNELSPKERQVIDKRINDVYKYEVDEKGDVVESDKKKYYEEYTTAFVEAVRTGQLSYRSESFAKLKKPVESILSALGFPKAKFLPGKEGAKEMYDMLKSIAEKAKTGQVSESAVEFAKNNPATGAPSGKTSYAKTAAELKIELKNLEENEFDYDPQDYDQQFINLEAKIKRAEVAEKAGNAIENKPTIKREQSEGGEVKNKTNLQNLLDTKYGGNPKRLASEGLSYTPSGNPTNDFAKSVIGKELGGTVETITRRLYDPITADAKRGVTRDEYKDALLQSASLLINNEFDASKQSLDKFISSRLNLRANALASELGIEGVTKGGIKADVELQKDLMASETAVETKEAPKYKNALDAKVFSPEVTQTMSDKMMPHIRALKTRIDAPVTLNRTVSPLISEINNAIGKELDIIIKKEMGGKKDNELSNWLSKHKRYVLENMTTTYLMGKNNGKEVLGGMPIAIQKRVNGKWLNYPEWIPEKIDRESVNTDKAGRTSGHELVRRVPNAWQVISDADFKATILGPDGNPRRGAKESLAAQVATDMGRTLITKDLENDGPLAETLKANQERQGVEIANNFAVEVIRQAEMGNVKYAIGGKVPAIEAAMKGLFDWQNKLKPEEYKLVKEYLGWDKKDVNFNPDSDIVKDLIWHINKIEAAGKKKLGSQATRLGSIAHEESLERIISGLKNSTDAKLIEGIKSFLQAELKSYKTSSGNFITTNRDYLVNVLQPAITKILGETKSKELFSKVFEVGVKEVNKKIRTYIRINGEDLRSYLPITEIKTSLSKNNEISKETINVINGEATLAGGHVINTLSYYKRKGDIKGGLDHINLLGTDMQGALRKMYKMGFYVSGLKSKDVILEHNTTINDVKKQLEDYLKDDNITDADLAKYIDGLKINLIPEKADQALTNAKLKYSGNGKLRNENLEFIEALLPFRKSLHNLSDMYGSEAHFDALAKDAPGAKNRRISKEKSNAVESAATNQYSKVKKGISVFDFDDTVGITSGSVLYTKEDGTVGKLNAEEFAKEGGQLLNDGVTFDFSEFSKVVDGKPGPMVEKMKKMINKFGPENFFILTARPSNAAEPIHEFLSSIGIDIPLENITGLGSSLAQSKADWMVGKVTEGYNDFYFADDAIQNVKAVKKALDIPGVDSKVQQAMIKYSLTSKQDLKWTYYEDSSFADFEVKGKPYKIELADSAYIDYPELLIPTINTLIEKYNLNKDDILQGRTGKTYQLIFEGYKGGTEITGTGNAAEVFGVVINGVIEYAKNKDTETFVFAAKEPSRRKLYNAMANVIANKIGWNSFYDNGVYIISKKGAIGNIETFNNQSEQVKNVLNVVDVKSPIQQAKIQYSRTMSEDFNKIIEENKGMESYKVFSDIVARRRGASKNKFDFYVPPSAADFELLLYNFMGKGSEGEAQKKFFSDTLLKPYSNGNDLMDGARQSIKKDYKTLTNQFPDIKNKIEKLTPDGDFTYDQAIRVAMWAEEGVEIPGLSQRDKTKLTDLVNNDPELNAFKQGLITTGRQGKGWITPTEYWDTSTIISDLHNLTEGIGRKKFLAEFIENSENIFGKFENGKLVGPNINKVEAVYGTNVREALEDSIYRMITGKNRSFGSDKETTAWSNWVNGSTGTIMFLNTRSAALQLIGSVNFLNLRDNNPIAAGKAFANQKQYWEDFSRIWNSDKMKERRGGLKEDVAAAEIANAAAGSKNKANAVVSYLLKIGYTPTQLADSFAIASGGSPFYRNRIKTYLKEGQSQAEAEANAWNDFTKVSDETQQSGDPRDISKQQASGAGRLLLTFQNTAMQQSRIVKKSFLDLKNGRGDAKTHVAKITYYLAIQNALFAALQQGLFAVAFDDDKELDPEKDKAKPKTTNERLISVADGVLDTILRGTGFLGGIVSTLKNMTNKYLDEKDKDFKADYAKVMLEGANISPPIGSKLRKVYTGLQQTKFEKDLIDERGWGVMQDGRVHLGPMYGVTGKLVEAGTNIPMDRLVNKIENVSQAMNSQNQAWQRVAVSVGFTPYSVGIEDTKGDENIRAKAKEVRAVEGKIKAKETRQRTKDSINALPMEERTKLIREAALKRRAKKVEEIKRRQAMNKY